MKPRTITIAAVALGAALLLSGWRLGVFGGSDPLPTAVAETDSSRRVVLGAGLVVDRYGVSGRVLPSATALPIDGADVLVFEDEPSQLAHPVARGETDIEGYFHIAELAAVAPYWITIQSGEHANVARIVLTGTPEEFSLASGVTLRGCIGTHAGELVEGAWVTVSTGRTSVSVLGVDRTDARGAFEIHGLFAYEDIRVTVQAPGRVEESRRFKLGGGFEQRHDILLAESLAIRLALIDYWTDVDLAHLPVRFGSAPAGPLDRVTDEFGRVEVGVPAPGMDTVAVSVTAEGFATTRIVLPRVAERRPRVVSLARLCAIEGRVIDERGDPLGDVRVSLRGQAYTEPGARVAIMGSIGFSARTDAGGHFVLEGVAPGTAYLRLRAELEGWRSSEIVLDGWLSSRTVLETAPSSFLVEEALVLQPCATLAGRVSMAGEPFRGVVLAGTRGVTVSSPTNAAGEFILRGLYGGDVQVAVMDPPTRAGPLSLDGDALYREVISVPVGPVVKHDILVAR